MKKFAVLLMFTLFCTGFAHAQAVRVDVPLLTSGPNVPVSGQPLPETLWLSNATANLCVHVAPPAVNTLANCIATPITTYTDSTAGTPCLAATPLVQLPGNTCTASTGALANLGFWYAGGTVDYFVTTAYGTYGPYTVSAGVGGGGGAGTITGIGTASGSGLQGGGTSGTLNLSLLQTCGANQILQYNGSAWICTTLSGGGTITGVTTGASSGLQGGGLTGTLNLSLLNTCANTQILAWNGSAWACTNQTTASTVPNQSVSFAGATSASLTISSSTNTAVWACWDNASPANAIEPGSVTLSAAYLMTFNFASNQTGYCVVNSSNSGGGGGGGGSITGITAGAGLTGGGTAGNVTLAEYFPITSLGAALTAPSGVLNIAAGGVTNPMLVNSSLTVTPGTGLSGGGSVPLGGSVTIQEALPITGVSSSFGLSSGTLNIASSGVSNAMLAHSSVTINVNSPLSGGGAVSLGGTTTISCPGCSGGSGSAIVPFTCGLTTPSTSATNYCGVATISNVEGSNQIPIARAGTLANLTCILAATETGTKAYALTIKQNGNFTSSTCTVNSSSSTCSDTTHTVTLAAQDLLDLAVVPANTPNSGVLSCTVTIQ